MSHLEVAKRDLKMGTSAVLRQNLEVAIGDLKILPGQPIRGRIQEMKKAPNELGARVNAAQLRRP